MRMLAMQQIMSKSNWKRNGPDNKCSIYVFIKFTLALNSKQNKFTQINILRVNIKFPKFCSPSTILGICTNCHNILTKFDPKVSNLGFKEIFDAMQ